MASNYNNDPFAPPDVDASGVMSSGSSQPPADPAAPPAIPTAPESPGLIRFRSCRWQQPKEEGSEEFCTHREVKPYAGTHAFDADAWCTDCTYYKLRRAPKKRQPSDDYSY